MKLTPRESIEVQFDRLLVFSDEPTKLPNMIGALRKSVRKELNRLEALRGATERDG